MQTKFCFYSNSIWAGVHKPGRRGEVINCPHCKKPVKLRIPPNGDRTYYVQIPRHKAAQPTTKHGEQS
jgi:hypothetical protein